MIDIVERLLDTKHHPWEICQDAADEIARLRSVCAEAYQLAGALGASVKAMDNLSAAAHGDPLPHETFLPVMESDEIVRLRDENARLRAELNAGASALPGPIYMDPPDGGSVTVAEQVARMTKDAARYRWLRTEASEADWEMFGYQDIDMTDAAIDAAMQKGYSIQINI